MLNKNREGELSESEEAARKEGESSGLSESERVAREKVEKRRRARIENSFFSDVSDEDSLEKNAQRLKKIGGTPEAVAFLRRKRRPRGGVGST